MKNKTNINIKDFIRIINNNSLLSVEKCCEIVYKDVAEYQSQLEKQYLKDFKEEIIKKGFDKTKSFDELASERTDIIYEEIQNKLKFFCIDYADKSIDLILDAINEKLIVNKINCDVVLATLTALKDFKQ